MDPRQHLLLLESTTKRVLRKSLLSSFHSRGITVRSRRGIKIAFGVFIFLVFIHYTLVTIFNQLNKIGH